MRDTHTQSGRHAPRVLAWTAMALLLLGTVSCKYDDRLTYGMTRKWEASPTHTVPKAIGVVVLSPWDSMLAPWFKGVDLIVGNGTDAPLYDSGHRYLSFSGMRAIGYSDMAWGYQAISWYTAFGWDLAYLPITGIIDVITVLATGDDGSDG